MSTICRTLHRLGFTYAEDQDILSMQRSEDARQAFTEVGAMYDPVYVHLARRNWV